MNDVEVQIQEQYNNELNEKMNKRKITSLITCPSKCNKGWFYSTICFPDKWKCDNCEGTGYVNATT